MAATHLVGKPKKCACVARVVGGKIALVEGARLFFGKVGCFHLCHLARGKAFNLGSVPKKAAIGQLDRAHSRPIDSIKLLAYFEVEKLPQPRVHLYISGFPVLPSAQLCTNKRCSLGLSKAGKFSALSDLPRIRDSKRGKPSRWRVRVFCGCGHTFFLFMRNCLASIHESKHSIKDMDLSEIIGILSFELRLSPVLLQYSMTSFFAAELLILAMS